MKKKIVPVWVSVILFVLCAVSIFGCVNLLWMINGSNALMTISVLLFICATVLAVLYGILNYSKKAHWAFLAFSIVFTLALLMMIAIISGGSLGTPLEGADNIPAIPEMIGAELPEMTGAELPEMTGAELPEMPSSIAGSWISSVICAIMFACVFTLTIAKDLGKKKSYALILATMIGAAYFVINHVAVSTSFIYIIADVNITAFVLSVIYGIMIYAKYKDKEARGTK